MKHTKLVLLLVLLALVIAGTVYVGFRPQSGLDTQKSAELTKLAQIKELTQAANTDPKYREHNSQASRELVNKLCSLTARTVEEREKAVSTIRGFLEMPTAEVKYECNDAFYDLEADRLVPAKSETYALGLTYFVVSPITNHVLQVDETPGIWGDKTDGTRWSSEQKDYDYSTRYSQSEVEQIARNFITKHTTALGDIDLSKLKLELGQKDGGGGKVNYFFVWKGESKTVKLDPPAETCSEDLDKNAEGLYLNGNGVPCIKRYESIETPTLSIAFTSGGQLINFSNELDGQIGRARVNQ